MLTSACSSAVQTSRSGLRAFGQFQADQVALDDRQAGPLQDLAALLRMAEQEADKRAFGGVADREGNDAHARTFKPADDFEELPDAVFQKDGELPDRRIVPTPHRGKPGPRAFANAHG